MSIFNITFRVVNDSTYNDRYTSMVEKIRAEAKGSTWEETTSFFVLESDSSAQALADAIYLGSKMSSKDQLLVVNLSTKSHGTKGDIGDLATLTTLMGRR